MPQDIIRISELVLCNEICYALKKEAIEKRILLYESECQQVTMYKNNSRDSSKFKDFSPLQHFCYLKGMKPAIGYYSYTNRYEQFRKTHRPEIV